MTAALRVLDAGPLATVQGLGRLHAQRYGVALGGAMDRFALQAANRLVDNPLDAAAIEITAGSAAFELLAPLLLAVTGADFGATLDDEPLPAWTTLYARAGQELRFGLRQENWGARAYLAVGGGIDVPRVLGARDTNLAGAFGGMDGRPLRSGDILAGGTAIYDTLPLTGRAWPTWARPPYTAQPRLRVLPGPHLDLFADDALAVLCAGSWQIGSQSNRMGYRLAGTALPNVESGNIPSHGVVPGTLQVPPNGAPILLMADAQPTGGYPIIAVVIAADIPLAAQLLPGDWLHFAPTTLEEAVGAWRKLTEWQSTPLIPDGIVEQLAWAAAIDVRLAP